MGVIESRFLRGTHLPLPPLILYIAVYGWKIPFFPSPCIHWSRYTDWTWGVDWWIVHLLGTGPYLVPVVLVLTLDFAVYRCKLFQIDMINRKWSFYPQGGFGGWKNFLATPTLLSGGGGGQERLHNVWNFLASEEWVPKQLEQVSIVGNSDPKYYNFKLLIT